ncbi:MAG: alanine racemase [Gammaproteobacteria bacterium]|nr:alanine racemase [Gammaproteobacteria bacterium]
MSKQESGERLSEPSQKLVGQQWRNARVIINLDALSHNLTKVKEYAPHSQVMAVIKANAYGHGMLAVAAQLEQADMFAVAMPEEAFVLRADGCTKPILVLHGFNTVNDLEKFTSLGISTVVRHRKQLTILQEHELSSPVDAWLKVDTGMHRLGVSIDQVDEYFGLLRKTSNVSRVYVMSHFANAEDAEHLSNIKQLEGFIKITNDIDSDCSMANSAAIIRMPESHFEVVRPGIMLYGASPLDDVSAAELGLQAVMQFESELMDVRWLHAGEALGYGGAFVADSDMSIGVVAAGYGDGYPRHAQNGTPVWINGQCCRLVGRVSMDSICIDLTGISASIGDRVVLWGEELSVDEVAQASSSISYELLCHTGAAYFSYQG